MPSVLHLWYMVTIEEAGMATVRALRVYHPHNRTRMGLVTIGVSYLWPVGHIIPRSYPAST